MNETEEVDVIQAQIMNALATQVSCLRSKVFQERLYLVFDFKRIG